MWSVIPANLTIFPWRNLCCDEHGKVKLQPSVEKQVSGQAATKRNSGQQTDKVEERRKADLDRLRFKLNQTMQMLKAEQKQQEGKSFTSTWASFH